MAIKHIIINNLRLIEEIEFEPADGLNLIWGANGSGKTTILEAIYLLGRGKSFRKAEREQLIKKGEQHLTLFVNTEDRNSRHALGLSKSHGITQARLDGSKVTRMSDLARAIPLTVITPNSHEILERGPQYRRRFLDWGVFHVEPGFRNAFERFVRCQKQRNAALRMKGRFDATWDKEFIVSGKAVNDFRERYFSKLSEKIKQLAQDLSGLKQIEIEWVRGWSEKYDLGHVIKEMEQGDLQAGYTRYGPHRADISIKLNGQKVEKIVSRGQQKMLVVAMHLAQVEISRAISGTETIVLIDDLTSELDKENRKKLLQYLHDLGNQVFITGVENISACKPGFSGVFHVEQGRISPG